MKSREIIIYLAMKFHGNWDRIYEFLTSHEEIDEKEAKKYLLHQKSSALTLVDDEYPESLKRVQKPPFVLFYHGDISLIKNTGKIISVVGSRKFSEYGQMATNKLVKDLSKEMIIVSGLALGIDGIAHRVCLESGGKTIAVLGCGINVCYPPSNLDLYDEIKKNYLLLSEYPDLTPPNPLNFPIRNRIVAALSCCTLIIEGKMNSGTSSTATISCNIGNYVCCVPTHIDEESLCNYLIANGAALVETADDVFLEIGYRKAEPIFEK